MEEAVEALENSCAIISIDFKPFLVKERHKIRWKPMDQQPCQVLEGIPCHIHGDYVTKN